MSICLPSTTIKWYCAFWLKRATQQHSIDCSHSVRVGLSHMMVMRGRGKEGWWQSWHGERDTHCTLRWRKRRRAAPLHHIPLSKHRRGEREGSQDVKRKKNCQENVYNRPASSSSFFLSFFFLSLCVVPQTSSIPLHQPRAVRSARCGSPSTDHGEEEEERCRSLLPPAWWIRALLLSLVCEDSVSAEKSSPVFGRVGIVSPPPVLSVSVCFYYMMFILSGSVWWDESICLVSISH